MKSPALASLTAAAVGAATWTLAEYGLHRFVGHGPRRKRPVGRLSVLHPASFAAAFAEEHIAHHADPTYFAPAWKKAAAAAVVVPALAVLGSLIAGRGKGTAFALGFVGSYLAYEALHRRIHTEPPRSRYARWVYRHHLSHHVSPKVNHGVTSPVWDHAAGTQRPHVGPVKLHVRIAPGWLKDAATGQVKLAHADDFEVVAPRQTAPAQTAGAAERPGDWRGGCAGG